MSGLRQKKTVIVAGDVTIDWNIAWVQRTDASSYFWSKENLTKAFHQRGGAALLADLMEEVATVLSKSKRAGFKVCEVQVPDSQVNPNNASFNHAYALCKPFRKDESTRGNTDMVWRVAEFMGVQPAGLSEIGNSAGVLSFPDNPVLIILDDAGLGFRNQPEYWPPALSNGTGQPWILLKMAPVLATGSLWWHLQRNHPERVVTVISANDLRRHAGVQISCEISWERTAQDLVWELLNNPAINSLTMFAHTVVSFGVSGALLLSRGRGNKLGATLFFDPKSMEDQWNHNYPGGMVGYTSCLAAAIARELVSSASKPDLHRGIQSGISAMRRLQIEGYGPANSDMEHNPIAFPVSSIAREIVESQTNLPTIPVTNPVKALSVSADKKRLWTILEAQSLGSLDVIAKRIVREGLDKALSGVPVGCYGKLVTVDRQEIEAANCIGNLLREYCRQPQKIPISIAVFGPPGSGKSFAVKQIANWVQPGEIETLTFNLSQLSGPEDLLNAFHQVRDTVLSGKIPLVFWDEFDTSLDGRQLGWLRYFLAPMQDGEFQEGQITHPIGRSIFVFAGSTSGSMETFTDKLEDEAYQGRKLSDFISRLRGFLNILGPNCQGNSPVTDPYYIIRRAILLRSILERNVPQLIHKDSIMDIDEGVLRALLLTGEYKHGARSMEGIILSSQLAGKSSFARSCLPTENQINLHVDGQAFYALVHLMEPDENLLEILAEAAHEVFCAHLKANGYRYGQVTSETKKMHISLKDYNKLSDNEKEQNRNNVRDIPRKLAMIGYTMVPARGKESAAKFNDDEMAVLARMEHERWMQEKLDAGWKFAEKTDNSKKQHKGLIPWDDLSREETDKDYIMVKSISQILARAGYTVAKMSKT